MNMTGRFGLICVATVVMITGGFAGTAKAQVISISSVQYTAPVVDPPKKATSTPDGTISVPNDNKSYRVRVDFGTFNMGNYSKNAGVSDGGVSGLIVVARGGTLNWTTVASGPFELTNPPANLYCRAVTLQAAELGYRGRGVFA
jgi:hypothetical protein